MRSPIWKIGLLLAVLLAGCNRQAPVQAKQDTGPIQVHVASIVTKQIRRVVESVGTMYPFEEVIISAEVDGPVRRVLCDLGDRVEQGQVLVEISDEEQRYLLAQNEAQLRQALERLGLKSPEEKVKDIRETPEVRRAHADLVDAQQRYKRVRDLVDQGIGATADLDEASARFQALQAGYDATVNQTRNLIQDVERVKAVVDLQRKKLRDTNVRAPFASYVKERQVTVGQYVRTNTPLLTLVKTDPIRLRLEVPERMAPWVREGQVAVVSVEAYENRTFRGKIWRISPTVDQNKRTFLVEALIDNPAGELKAGSYARARISTDKTETIKLAPASAVNYILGTNKIYVVHGSTVEARDVKVGDRFGEQVEIMEGAQEGEQVATSQLNRLDTGVAVKVVEGDEPPPAHLSSD
jgi:RND family efflux transporter MFP subunit